MASLVAQMVKNLPAMRETRVRSLGWEDPLEEGIGRSPGGGNSNPLRYSCLENPTNRGDWQTTVHAVAESNTPEGLTHTHAFIYMCVCMCVCISNTQYCLSYTVWLWWCCSALGNKLGDTCTESFPSTSRWVMNFIHFGSFNYHPTR